MQRILIVSDTHKRLGNLYEALEKEGSVDARFILGIWKVMKILSMR